MKKKKRQGGEASKTVFFFHIKNLRDDNKAGFVEQVC